MLTFCAGVVSGLNRAIPSPVGTTIRGAIQVTTPYYLNTPSGFQLPDSSAVSVCAFDYKDTVGNQATSELLCIALCHVC